MYFISFISLLSSASKLRFEFMSSMIRLFEFEMLLFWLLLPSKSAVELDEDDELELELDEDMFTFALALFTTLLEVELFWCMITTGLA